MPRTSGKARSLEVTGLPPLPAAIEEWERALIEPLLARTFDAPKRPTVVKDVRGGKDAR